MYKIQSEIAIPVDLKVSNRGKRKYPFRDMKVGDSFLIPFSSTKDCPKKIRQKLSQAATNYRTAYCVKDIYGYALCPSSLGIRCWRIE